MEDAKFKEFCDACEHVIRWLRENANAHSVVHVSQNGAELLSTEVSHIAKWGSDSATEAAQAGPAQVSEGQETPIPGCGRMTRDDAFLTLEFTDEDAACGFMGKHRPGVEIDQMPATQTPAAQAVSVERERWTTLLTEKWHAGEGKGQTLAQYMGMSDEEYAAWVTQTTPPAQEALPVHEVWREGYRITGASDGAMKLGEAQAATFAEACDIVCRSNVDYDSRTRRVWGCELFSNEADARRSFG